jgi:hypothetical protein
MIRIQKLKSILFAARKKSLDFSNQKPTEYWTKINDAAQKGDAEGAEKLLFKKKKLTCYEYSMVLNAWSRDQSSAEAPQRAEKILATMWENFESGELDTKPNVVSYTTLINCWAKSRQKGGADRAEAIFREM